MTIKFDNVYINETATITGPYEKNGPLQSYFDKSYNDLYKPNYMICISSKDFGYNPDAKIKSIPLYAVFLIKYLQ